MSLPLCQVPVAARLPVGFYMWQDGDIDRREAAREFVSLCELVERARGGVVPYQIPVLFP